MPTCTHCGRSFGTPHGLKIHVGRSHESAARKARAAGGQKRKRRGRPPGRPKGSGRKMTQRRSSGLAKVSTADLVAELRRRAELGDRLKSIASAN